MPLDPPSTSPPSQSSATSAYTMATAINLPTFPEFELQSRDTAPTRFEKYVKRLNNMFTAMSITRASQKKAMALHYVGEETCDVFETVTVPEPTEGNDEYKTAVKALTDYFELQKCLHHHVYVFRQETQKCGENIPEFYTRLQLLARKCEFANTELPSGPEVSRLFQFAHGNFNFGHGNFNFAHGYFNLLTAISSLSIFALWGCQNASDISNAEAQPRHLKLSRGF